MRTGNVVTPTSTVLQARVMIYQPSQRPKVLEGVWMKTSFGHCRISGRLGQRHADIVECILYVAERRRDVSDGGIELLVDPAKLRGALSDHQYSYSHIDKLLTELQTTSVKIITPELERAGEKIIGGLIDHVIPSPMTRPDPLTGGKRHLWRIRLGVALVMLLERDLSLYYDPAPITRLEHGVSQAVVRHILTHKNDPAGGWHLDTLIRAVCGEDLSSQSMRNARRQVKKDVEGLAKMGIELSEDSRVRRVTPAR